MCACNMLLDVTLGYLQLLQVTIGYQHYQVLGMCACNMLLDVTLGYLQLLQVTIGYQHYQVLGMCACNMLLDVTLGYLQVLQRYQVLGMCACNMLLDVTSGYHWLPVFGCMCRICYWFLVRSYCSGLYYAFIVLPSSLAIGWVTMLPLLLGNITINRQLFSALSPISSHYCVSHDHCY